MKRNRAASKNVKSFKVKKTPLKKKQNKTLSEFFNLFDTSIQDWEEVNKPRNNIVFNKFMEKISFAKELCKTLGETLNEIESDYSNLCCSKNVTNNKENEDKIHRMPMRKSLRINQKQVQRVMPLVNGHLVYTNPSIRLSRMNKNAQSSNFRETEPSSLVIKNRSFSIETNPTELHNLPAAKVFIHPLPINLIQNYIDNSATSEPKEESKSLVEISKNKISYNLKADFKLKTPVVPLRDIRVLLQESTISIQSFERKQRQFDFFNTLAREDPLEGPSWKFQTQES